MKLIPNWRKAYRMLSVQAMAVVAAIQGCWAAFPEDLKTNLPTTLVHWVSLALLVLGIGGRLMDQPKTKDE